MRRLFLAGAVALTALLLWAAASLSAAQMFLPRLHGLLHFGTFAVLTLLWVRGLPRVSPLVIALAVVAFGFAHEAIEIVGHAHAYELRDALIDGAGAACGALLASVVRRRLSARASQCSRPSRF